MKTCLISMPFAPYDFPQVAIGALSAYVRQKAPRQKLDSRYEYTKVWDKMPTSYSRQCGLYGELVYLSHLYPERKELIKSKLLQQKTIRKTLLSWKNHFLGEGGITEDIFEQSNQVTGDHLSSLADEIACLYEVVGLSTTFAQLFSSLALANQLKKINPKLKIVLGGHCVAYSPGKILDAFSFVDFVIPGEGELPLVDLLNGLDQGREDFSIASGIVTRMTSTAIDADWYLKNQERLPDLDQLPTPDYREFIQLAQELNMLAAIPVEGGRGCWWNRVRETGDPFAACHFCGFNHQKKARQKATSKLADEIDALTDSFQSTRFNFLESTFRSEGVIDLAKALKKKKKEFIFDCSPRPNITPLELLELQEAGCRSVEPGFEGLSNSFLKRVRKGTTVIQILQVMKTCFELGIHYNCNLLVNFPGTTQQEIDETVRNLNQYAVCYLPGVGEYNDTSIIPFFLDPYSTVYCRPDHFGITNIRNRHLYRSCLPEELAQLLVFGNLEYDDLNPQADWNGLRETLIQVQGLYQRLKEKYEQVSSECKPLYYMDGINFLVIVDQRQNLKSLTLENEWRQVYLFCTKIRSASEISKEFSGLIGAEKIEKEILPALVAEKVMFEENHRFLSLAVAPRPELAAKRIRSQHFSSQAIK